MLYLFFLEQLHILVLVVPGGYTVTIKNERFSASYCHVFPSFLVYVGQIVNQGDIIAKVGPKLVYGISNNPYHDSNGNPTNGATTGPHLHLTLKENNKIIDPLKYFLFEN